jgi:hypothetical protein
MGRDWPVVRPQGMRGLHRWPKAESEDDRHCGQRPERQNEGIEEYPRRRLCNSSLASGSKRRQGYGEGNGADRTSERHDQVAGHREGDEQPPIGTEGCDRGIVITLGDALAGNCLPDHC